MRTGAIPVSLAACLAKQDQELNLRPQGEAADRLRVSRRLVQSAREVLEHGEPDLVRAVDQGACGSIGAVAHRNSTESFAAIEATSSTLISWIVVVA
jgi:hypothetical protein